MTVAIVILVERSVIVVRIEQAELAVVSAPICGSVVSSTCASRVELTVDAFSSS
jgi:hypothetical protein